MVQSLDARQVRLPARRELVARAVGGTDAAAARGELRVELPDAADKVRIVGLELRRVGAGRLRVGVRVRPLVRDCARRATAPEQASVPRDWAAARYGSGCGTHRGVVVPEGGSANEATWPDHPADRLEKLRVTLRREERRAHRRRARAGAALRLVTVCRKRAARPVGNKPRRAACSRGTDHPVQAPADSQVSDHILISPPRRRAFSAAATPLAMSYQHLDQPLGPPGAAEVK